MGGEVGITLLHRFTHEVEGHRDPGNALFGIDAGLGERHLEGDLGRGRNVVGCDALARHVLQFLHARGFGCEQALATTVGAHEELDVETLFQRLQPIEQEARAGIGLVGGQRLDQRLTAGALVEQLNVHALLGVEALLHAEAQGRVTGRHLRPGEAHLGCGAGYGRSEKSRPGHACGGCRPGTTGNLQQLAPR